MGAKRIYEYRKDTRLTVVKTNCQRWTIKQKAAKSGEKLSKEYEYIGLHTSILYLLILVIIRLIFVRFSCTQSTFPFVTRLFLRG